MIRVSVHYPAQEGSRFDHDYYQSKHFPMVRQTLGAAPSSNGREREIVRDGEYTRSS